MNKTDDDKNSKIKSVEEDDSVGEISSYEETSGWKGWLKKLEVENQAGLSTAQAFLINHDLKPVEEARRLWSWYNYVFFWIADSFNIRYVFFTQTLAKCI